MRICLVASEAVPFAKTGGLADVVGALQRYLSRRGHDVRLFLPFYRGIEIADLRLEVVAQARSVAVTAGERTLTYSLRQPRWPSPVYLVDCGELYDREAIYTQDADEPLRFAFLCRAAIDGCHRLSWTPDVFHGHDWHAGLLPLYVEAFSAAHPDAGSRSTLLTIHNLAYQGVFPADCLSELQLGDSRSKLDQGDLASGWVNFLKTGIEHADLVSTVSPSYAREIQSEEQGMGLDGFLGRRSGEIVGILNGIDTEVWNPEADPHIPHRYSSSDLAGKEENKKALLAEVGLPPDPNLPLAGLVSRLVAQKGLDLMVEGLPPFLAENRLRLVALGTGEQRYEDALRELAAEYPQAVSFRAAYDDALAHRIEAASDLFLMPSQFEPCGLNQMYSLRYGTVPLVRNTGGLADSVQPFEPASGHGTGFRFDEFTVEAFSSTLAEALGTWQDRELWHRLVLSGMAQDLSWERRVEQYEALYASLAPRA